MLTFVLVLEGLAFLHLVPVLLLFFWSLLSTLKETL